MALKTATTRKVGANRARKEGVTSPKTSLTTASPFLVKREDQSLRSKAVDNIRKAIFSLYFKPGDRLSERKLCELTGVSRPLMREALRDLEAQGLIFNIPHRSPVVVTLTPENAHEIYEVRSALEPMAARLFVERATTDEVAQLRFMVERCREAMESKNVLALIDSLQGFYTVLFTGAGNRTAALFARTLHNKASLLRALTFRYQTEVDTKQSMKHIKQIADAIQARDADAAAAASLNQVNRSCKVAMHILASRIE
jgi:DNA-binding GntR family transcriptional regulator